MLPCKFGSKGLNESVIRPFSSVLFTIVYTTPSMLLRIHLSTGGPNSSCKIIILVKSVMARYLRPLFKVRIPSNSRWKLSHLSSTVHRLLSDCLICWNEAILANYPFQEGAGNLEMDNSLYWLCFNKASLGLSLLSTDWEFEVSLLQMMICHHQAWARAWAAFFCLILSQADHTMC